jgi:LysR family transcriptional regulator, nitrogen assimilation regulatory protein
LDLRQLRYLQCIMESKSFTRAAKVLRIAQPALSLHVRKLEEELQTQLLIRHTRGIEPTPAGALLLQKARRIIRDIEAAKHMFKSPASRTGNVCKIGIVQTMPARITAQIAQRVANECSGTVITVHEAASPGLVEALLAGEIAAAVVHHFEELPAGLVREAVNRERLLFVRSPSSQGRNRTLTIAEAIRCPLVLPPSDHALHKLLKRIAAELNVELAIPVEVRSVAARCELVMRGCGCSFIPASAAVKAIASGALVAETVVGLDLMRMTSLAYWSAPVASSVDMRLRAAIREALEGAAWETDVAPRPARTTLPREDARMIAHHAVDRRRSPVRSQ